MNYGKVEERSSSRSRSPNTARRAATSAILTDILSRSDRAPTSRTADARPGKSILIVPEQVVRHSEKGTEIRNGTPGSVRRCTSQPPPDRLTRKLPERRSSGSSGKRLGFFRLTHCPATRQPRKRVR